MRNQPRKARPMELTEKYRERDKGRPIIVHSLGVLIQGKTGCDDASAIEAAWDIFDYIGQPARLPAAE